MADEVTPEKDLEGNEGDTGKDTDVKELSPEEMKSELAKVRREAAGHRVEKQKLKDELREYNAWKDSQKSELERAKEEAEALKRELAKEKRSRQQLDAAKKAGLDLDLADRIAGTSPEEMLEDAKLLAGKLKPNGANAEDLGAGGRGRPVDAKRSTDWLKTAWNK